MHGSLIGSDPTAPGLNTSRLVRLMRGSVSRLELDLSGRHVVTEAATGAYCVTPVIAALAGAASVTAVTADSRHGSVEQVELATASLARQADVSDRIEVVDRLSPKHLRRADVVTNTGHVRPLDSTLVSHLRPSAVIPLMYEAWELAARPSDLDLAAISERGIAISGTNERHPDIDVFSYLGVMAASGLLQAGVAVYRSQILVLCDNEFGRYLHQGLSGCGASVSVARCWGEIDTEDLDAVVYALTPQTHTEESINDLAKLARSSPGAVILQFWGNLNRDAALASALPVWPTTSPAAGHMGVLPSAIGPEPVIRLQAGGLKVAQVLLKPPDQRTQSDTEFLDDL
jgi:hypothetical protein